eukprot:scaffold182798_cov14-Prasinocladus_malaysianus.AAC.1
MKFHSANLDSTPCFATRSTAKLSYRYQLHAFLWNRIHPSDYRVTSSMVIEPETRSHQGIRQIAD